LLLWAIAALLTLGAGGLGFLLVREVARILRDVVSNREPDMEELFGGQNQPGRRITPFRDRGTIERLVSFFRRDHNN
jgi:hypothetical protein